VSRIVCQFSCGAASAVTTKLAIAEYGDSVVIVNAFIKNEDADNRRFLATARSGSAAPSPFYATKSTTPTSTLFSGALSISRAHRQPHAHHGSSAAF
jgi:hypothetical protein